MIDTKERIARSNIYSIFGKLMNRLIDNNDNGEVLLKKAGLSRKIIAQTIEVRIQGSS